MKMIHAFIPILFLLLFASCNSENPIVKVETEFGDIEIVLFEEEAPITVSNFLEYIDKGLFNVGEFYRVVTMENQPSNTIKIEVIQGGIGWDDNLPRLDSIVHESTKQTGIKHENGIISMARNKPGSASSEFFICIGSQPELDFGGQRNPDGFGFAAFGKVIKGMNIVELIHNQPNKKQFLEPTIKIKQVSRVN